MRYIRIISRILVGIVFIFSGFVKAMDPLGSTYKFQDYFTAFHLDFLSFTALPMAIILSMIELVIGLNLLVGIRMKVTSWILLPLSIFFTLLTLFIAITNPVTDCGCFGDCLILTNWQTFYKNTIIIVLVIFIFKERKNFTSAFHCKIEWMLTIVFIAFSVFLSIYCLNNLPVIDCRPYKIGANIPEGMVIPEGAPKNEYAYKLVYEKDGVVKKDVTLADTNIINNWNWVSTETILIKKGYEPPIHDFSISSINGEDLTDLFLENEDYTFLIIAYDLNKTNKNSITKINDLIHKYRDAGTSFICLTSSTYDDIELFKSQTNPEFEFFQTDEITLKTIIRSNPGLLLLRKGTIIGKWHFNNIPENFGKEIGAYAINEQRIKRNKLLIISLMSCFFLAFSVFYILYKQFSKK